MRGLLLLVPALLAAADDPYLEEVRAALDKTAAEGYAFEVKGRRERTGEVKPPGIVTSRMKHYQSARNGEEILVKGPEGLWKTPEERLGEKVERGQDPDAPAIVRTLQQARAPHEILQELLVLVAKGREPQDREVDGLMCKRYLLPFSEEALRKSLDEQMGKAVQAGELERPDKVRWSTARGSVAVYLAKGLLRKVKDERLVELEYKVPDLPPRVLKYKLEWEYDYSSWGKVTLTIPKEIRERLKIKDE